jgi:hypothetical protein
MTVTPEEPTFVQPVCFDGTDASLKGSVTIPSITGVVYVLHDEEVSGTHALGAGVHVVMAEPAEGYKFPDDATTEWEVTIGTPPGCPGDDGLPGVPGQTVTVPAATPAPAVVGRPSFTG